MPPTVVLSCYVSVGVLQIIKHLYSYFAPLPCAREVEDSDDEMLLDNSRIRQLADCQFADWTTRGLDISQTGQLAD